MSRLTKLEKSLLYDAAQLVLAGEWPWEGDDSKKAERKEQRERAALISACEKLYAKRPKKPARKVEGIGSWGEQ